MKPKHSLGTLKHLPTATLFFAITACGGGGGGGGNSTPGGGSTPPPAMETLTLVGDIQGITASKVVAWQGNTRIGETAPDANGQYKLQISYEKARDTQPVHLIATSSQNARHLFASQLYSPAFLASKAGADKSLDINESVHVRVNEFSTARYALILTELGTQAMTDDGITRRMEDRVHATDVQDYAVLTRMLVRGASADARYDVPGTQQNSLELFSKRTALLDWALSLQVNKTSDRSLYWSLHRQSLEDVFFKETRSLPISQPEDALYGERFSLANVTKSAATFRVDESYDSPSPPFSLQMKGNVVSLDTGNHRFTDEAVYAGGSKPIGQVLGFPEISGISLFKVTELNNIPVYAKSALPKDPAYLPGVSTERVYPASSLTAFTLESQIGKSTLLPLVSIAAVHSKIVSGNWWTAEADNFVGTVGSASMTVHGVDVPWRVLDDGWTRFDLTAINGISVSYKSCPSRQPPLMCLMATSTSPSSQSFKSLFGAQITVTNLSPSDIIGHWSLDLPNQPQSPRVRSPLNSYGYSFEANGTAILWSIRDANFNGAIESKEKQVASGKWSLSGNKVVLDFLCIAKPEECGTHAPRTLEFYTPLAEQKAFLVGDRRHWHSSEGTVEFTYVLRPLAARPNQI